MSEDSEVILEPHVMRGNRKLFTNYRLLEDEKEYNFKRFPE